MARKEGKAGAVSPSRRQFRAERKIIFDSVHGATCEPHNILFITFTDNEPAPFIPIDIATTQIARLMDAKARICEREQKCPISHCA